MIAYTAFLLFFIGVFTSFSVSLKYDKLLSAATFLSLLVVFLNFFYYIQLSQEQIFSYIWNSSPAGDIKIDIISNAYNYAQILPFFIITLLAVAHNLFFRYEEKRSSHSALLILNLAALIMMITSNNFVQLLSAMFFVDILAVLMIRKVKISKRFILVNLTADMLLFMVLAIINGRVASFDIREILQYKQSGSHVDFMAVIGLTAVFLKMGFFIFQIGIIALQEIRMHRLINVLFLFSPVAALLILLKFSLLWSASPYFSVYLHALCVLTLIWGFWGSLLSNNLKAKIIYWQAMFWALFIELLRFNGFVWFAEFTYLLLAQYVLFNAVYLIYFSFNRKIYVQQMIEKSMVISNNLRGGILLILLTITILADTLTILYNRLNRYYIWTYAVLFVLSFSAFIRQVYFYPQKHPNKNISHMSAKWLFITELMAICVFMLKDAAFSAVSVWGIMAVFALLCRTSPLYLCAGLYNNEKIQKMDYVGMIYHQGLALFMLIGRFLWIFFDRMLMERLVTQVLRILTQLPIRIFRKLHNENVWGILLVILIMALLLYLSYMKGIMSYV